MAFVVTVEMAGRIMDQKGSGSVKARVMLRKSML